MFEQAPPRSTPLQPPPSGELIEGTYHIVTETSAASPRRQPKRRPRDLATLLRSVRHFVRRTS